MLNRRHPLVLAALALLAGCLGLASPAGAASEGEKPRKLAYQPSPPAPKAQTPAQAAAKSEGCLTCHTATTRRRCTRTRASSSAARTATAATPG
jgi:nitrate reductase cytochrome c-type subunit